MNEELLNIIRAALPGAEEAQNIKFARYAELLMDWNTRINLTAITAPEDIANKHFADSILPLALIPKGARLIDVGTGAGFPGVPIKLMRPDIQLTLLDSLNKRINFLKELCSELEIEANCIHARAEDAGRDSALRGRFDIATTRAVGSISMLCEYTLPLLKNGGSSLMYKGGDAENELSIAQNALKLLKGEARITHYETGWGARSIVCVSKRGDTPKAYPRKAGAAEKQPL